MAKFKVVRTYSVEIEDDVWRNIPYNYRSGFVDACTRMVDVGDNKALYLYGSGEDAYWGDYNDGIEAQGQIGPFEWRAEEVAVLM